MLVSVVVPLHDEEGNAERVVERLLDLAETGSLDHQLEIVLVDDNSTDRTPTICDELADRHDGVRVVHRTDSPGFGNAVKAGLAVASGDVLVPFMGDLSDDPEDVPRLVAAIESGYHVAFGSRFVEGGSISGYPPLKLLYNRSYNNLIRLLFGIRAKDVTNAFTAYRREVIEEIGIDSLASESFDLTAELPLRAHIRGFKSTEVPVSWRSRDAGVSKLDATQKGPVYLRRLLGLFVRGNVEGLRDVFGAVTSGGPLRTLGAAGLGVLILVGLFSVTGLDRVLGVLAGANLAWLGVAAAAYVGSFLFRTWRYRVLLRTSGHLSTRGGVFRSIMTGWFVNFILPARAGDVARGVALKTTEDVPFGVATGLVVLERLLDMMVLGGTMVVLAVTLLPLRQAGPLAVGALGIAAALAVLLAVAYFLDEWVSQQLSDRFPKVRRGLDELHDALERVVENPYAIALAALISVPVWVLEASTIFLSARALGIDLSAVGTVTTGIAAFLAQAVPVTPAGIGTYEATIAATASLFGVERGAGTALGVVDHFVRLVTVYTIGAISTVHIGFRSRAYFKEHSDADPTETEESVASGQVGMEPPETTAGDTE